MKTENSRRIECTMVYNAGNLSTPMAVFRCGRPWPKHGINHSACTPEAAVKSEIKSD